MTAISKTRSGPPEAAISLKRMMQQHQGIFIASPEYNASVTPLLKNTLDWVSRVREGKEAPLAAYRIAPLRSAAPRTAATARCDR